MFRRWDEFENFYQSDDFPAIAANALIGEIANAPIADLGSYQPNDLMISNAAFFNPDSHDSIIKLSSLYNNQFRNQMMTKKISLTLDPIQPTTDESFEKAGLIALPAPPSE